jgi:hypothetical protein
MELSSFQFLACALPSPFNISSCFEHSNSIWRRVRITCVCSCSLINFFYATVTCFSCPNNKRNVPTHFHTPWLNGGLNNFTLLWNKCPFDFLFPSVRCYPSCITLFIFQPSQRSSLRFYSNFWIIFKNCRNHPLSDLF